jgi:hypothetical protein
MQTERRMATNDAHDESNTKFETEREKWDNENEAGASVRQSLQPIRSQGFGAYQLQRSAVAVEEVAFTVIIDP